MYPESHLAVIVHIVSPGILTFSENRYGCRNHLGLSWLSEFATFRHEGCLFLELFAKFGSISYISYNR